MKELMAGLLVEPWIGGVSGAAARVSNSDPGFAGL